MDEIASEIILCVKTIPHSLSIKFSLKMLVRPNCSRVLNPIMVLEVISEHFIFSGEHAPRLPGSCLHTHTLHSVLPL